MLVEVLVGSTILLVVFSSILTQMSSLTRARLRVETRDRVVAYINSLHEVMSAVGCGFDVDTVDDSFARDVNGEVADGNDPMWGSFASGLKGPWDRISGCAFSTHERAYEDDSRQYSYVDGNNNLRLSVNVDGSPSSEPITREVAEEYCSLYGDVSVYVPHACELGDQTYTHALRVNDENGTVDIEVSINYWFEVMSGSDQGFNDGLSRKSTCSQIMSSGVMPDTIARRVSITFPNASGGTETMTVVKRQNVPIDSFQFASGTRVGIATNSVDAVSMFPNGDVHSPWKITRMRANETSCIWFPFLQRHEPGEDQPLFSLDNASVTQATFSDIPALSTGTL